MSATTRDTHMDVRLKCSPVWKH